ncbi:MAG: hypothetical protein HY000_33640 [Planctomycetes bacterium]|nr:hypothetical protein [Planctomycetota bacterium]
MADSVVDACCVINLYAAGDLANICPALGLTLHIPTKVREEALFLRRIQESEVVLEPIDLTPAVEAGLLHICTLEASELALSVQLAVELDDGEATALAIAKSRGWIVATDDRKARRIADGLGVTALTTPELMKRWADNAAATSTEIAAALRRVRDLASFVPRKGSPVYPWWTKHLD